MTLKTRKNHSARARVRAYVYLLCSWIALVSGCGVSGMFLKVRSCVSCLSDFKCGEKSSFGCMKMP